MISYSTNWMGPVGMWWFRDNGYTRMVAEYEKTHDKIRWHDRISSRD